MLTNTALSTTNYDQTLAGWASQTVQNSVLLNATGLTYCEGESARSTLINTYSWSISGDTKECPNNAPTAIALTASSINENNTVGDVVGTFATTDADAADTHTYTLIAGTGDTDNASFTINGADLQANAVFDFETKSSYSIRVQTNDGNGGTFEKELTISVVNELPVLLSPSPANGAIDVNYLTDIVLTFSEPVFKNTSGILSYIVNESKNAVYKEFNPDDVSISGWGSTEITIQTTRIHDVFTTLRGDQLYSYFYLTGFFVDANNISLPELARANYTFTTGNAAPYDITKTGSSVLENSSIGTSVFVFSSTDEPGDTHTYSLVAGTEDTHNNLFSISGNELVVADGTINYEETTELFVRVQSTDNNGLTYSESFKVIVSNVDQFPALVGNGC